MKRGLKSADELAQVGLRQHRVGELAAAERSYRAALLRDSNHVGALTLLSTLLLERRDDQAATSLLQQAARLAPSQGIVHTNLGEALRRLGRNDEALQALEHAVRVAPELAEAHFNLGLLHDQAGRTLLAIEAYEAALELQPQLPRGLWSLLGALRDEGENARAVRWYERLQASLPDTVELRRAVAGALLDVFRVDDAIRHLEHALRLEPDAAGIHAELGVALAERGEIELALEHLRRAVSLAPQTPEYQSHLVYLMAFSPDATASSIHEAARAFDSRHAGGLERPSGYDNSRAAEKRLRIGYVSSDFRTHAVALFLLPLLREHDPQRVEVYCYSNGRRVDAVTEQYRLQADAWRDISALSDDEAARLVREDRIDVLIDLGQHSAPHRLLLFARKPAPVQVAWLGYPGTTGVSAIDYRLTDARLDPPELGAAHSAEKPLRLAQTFWCYGPARDEPGVSPLPALANGYITFGSLNSFKKCNQQTQLLWLDVLDAVPSSRLIVVAPRGLARQRLLQLAAERGIEPGRLELLSHQSRGDYLSTYQRIDVALDPVPYGGGTTSLDALWMGVPVVTISGDTPAARAGAALAHHLDLSACVASSKDDYVARARAITSDTADLARCRGALRSKLLQSPLGDVPRFARDFEQALRETWRTFVSSGA